MIFYSWNKFQCNQNYKVYCYFNANTMQYKVKFEIFELVLLKKSVKVNLVTN